MEVKTKLKLGAHLSIAGGIHKALVRAKKLECNTVQIFLKNNNRWFSKPLNQNDIELFKQKLKSFLISPLIAHSGYLANLASPIEINRERAIDNIIDDMIRVYMIGLDYLVIHPGASIDGDINQGLRRLSSSLLSIINSAPPVKILLETSAGSGTQICYRFDQIAKIIDLLDNKIGVCIDTCHIFAAGYKINTELGFYYMIKEIEDTIGLSKINVIHLNDSKYRCGSRIDRHQHIGMGQIGLNSFELIINFPQISLLPFIIETPKEKNADGVDMDLINLSVIRSLYQKRGSAGCPKTSFL